MEQEECDRTDSVRVSIIIAARNIESTIAETLNSVLEQNFQQWEALVVVNASSDATRAIAGRFAAKDRRICVIEQSVPGVSAARNHGIELAQYDWLLFLDGDDWIAPNHLQRMTDALRANPQASAVYCGWCWVSPDGYQFHRHIGKETGDLFQVHADECPHAIHAYVIHRNIINAVGRFDPELHTCEDWDIWQRVSRAGIKFARVPEVLAPCRMRALSASTDGRKILADGLKVLTKGHEADARVPYLHPKYPNGLPHHELSEKKLYLLCSSAGLLIGRHENPDWMVATLTQENYPNLDFYEVADCIVLATLLSACRPLAEWGKTWTEFEPGARDFFIALETHSGIDRLAENIRLVAPRLAQTHMGPIGGFTKLRSIGVKMTLFPYKLKARVPRYVRFAKYQLKRYVVAALRLVPRLNQWALKIHRRIHPAEDQTYFQELFDGEPDPWSYSSAYEQTKYEQTLDMFPDHSIQNAIELGCAEGHFSVQFAPKVKHLLCTDISDTALERAAERCNQFENVSFQRLDIFNDPIPGKFDLMICSEVLYYAGSRKNLRSIARKLANALSPKGQLIMAHGNLVVDEPDQTGFNWSHEFGAKGIGEIFSEVSDLRFERELHMPLYRIQCFKKIDPAKISRNANTVQVTKTGQPTELDPEVESQVLWNGTSNRLPILLYHSITPERSSALKEWTVSPHIFEEQLSALREAGCQTVTIDDCYNWIYESTPLPKNAVLITFDDGYQDFVEYAWPSLQRHKFTATVFLVANEIGKINAWDSKYGEIKQLMDWNQILQLRDEGVSFGSHSASHPVLTSNNLKFVLNELQRSKDMLEQRFNESIKSFAYPYGENNIITRFLTGITGYDLALTCTSQISQLRHSPLALPRIEITESDRGESIIKSLGLKQLSGNKNSWLANQTAQI